MGRGRIPRRQRGRGSIEVIERDVAQSQSDDTSQKTNDDALVEKDADELGGGGTESFHDTDFAFFLDGDGKHDRHN